MEVAGPGLELDEPLALSATCYLLHACWFLLRRDQPAEAVEEALTMPCRSASPAQHLSVDLLFRLLPALHRRARAQDPADTLTSRLSETLRSWPLSGVLSCEEEGPAVTPEFGGHPGLLMLYADRWAQTCKPAWTPAGVGHEHLDLVWRELGRDPKLLPSGNEKANDG